jgi:tetratricopeptide (TPR) repeat protein
MVPLLRAKGTNIASELRKKEAVMSHKRIIIAATCVLLAAMIAVLGCVDTAILYLDKGNRHLARGQFDEAIAAYTRVIELDSGYVLAYSNRGEAYYSIGEYDEAVADYTKAIKLAPEFWLAYYHRGLVYEAKGEYEEAASDYEKVIEMSTDPEIVEGARQALEGIGK